MGPELKCTREQRRGSHFHFRACSFSRAPLFFSLLTGEMGKEWSYVVTFPPDTFTFDERPKCTYVTFSLNYSIYFSNGKGLFCHDGLNGQYVPVCTTVHYT